jgi:hypothetical protein
MTYRDVLENSDRDSRYESHIILVDGIGTFEHNGEVYEVVKKVRMRGTESCLIKYDLIDNKFELFEHERVYKRAHNSFVKFIPCEIKSVSKITRVKLYPIEKHEIDPTTYSAGDKIC